MTVNLHTYSISGFCKRTFFRWCVFFIFFIFIFPSDCFARRGQIESLKKALPSLHDSARVDCLNALSGIYIKFIRDTLGYCDMPLSETHSLPTFSSLASHYTAEAYEEAVKINYIPGIAEALSYKAEIEDFSDNFPAEEMLSREAIYWYKKTPKQKRLAEIYLILGESLYAQSFFTEAIKNFDTAYEWHKKNGNKIGMYWTLSITGAVYHESGNYEKAFELARKCLDLAMEINNDWFRRLELVKIGWLFKDIEDYKTALEYYRKSCVNTKQEALRFAQSLTLLQQYDSAKYYYGLADTSDLRTLRFYLVGIGKYYFLQKQYDKALPNLLRSLNYHEQYNDRNQVMRALLDIANTYLALGNDDLAFKYANKGLSIAKQTGAKQFIKDACEILFSVYDYWHQPDSAYFYYKQYTIMKDSVLNNQVKGKLAAYTFEQKMELLNKEKQIQQAQLQKESLIKNILIVGVIVLLLFGVIIFRNIILKRKSEVHRRELAENELQIQKLESEKTKVELQQQATNLEMQALRAQMNPHFIFNALNAINHFILKNESETAASYLINFSRLIRMVLNNSSKSFIPLEDELETLQLYIDLERLRFKNSFDYKCNYSNKIDVYNICIPPLILQPFVENAIWHGLMHKETKGHLEIELFQEEDVLCCKITDDGVGRNKGAALKSKSVSTHKSMGMRITADRIAILQQKKQLDTTIKISDLVLPDGSPGGTEVLLKIPVMQ